MLVGVLGKGANGLSVAVQGAFIEHLKVLKELGVDGLQVKKGEELSKLDALIIPGKFL
jgi:5'-phosphate synthase pdxT subunit